jgi:hypothetical protein
MFHYSVKELAVWQKAMDTYSEVCRLAELLPEEIYRLEVEQKKFKDLGILLPFYIEEGYKKKSSREIVKNFLMAIEAKEKIVLLLQIYQKKNYLAEEDLIDAYELIERLDIMLTSFCEKLEQRNKPIPVIPEPEEEEVPEDTEDDEEETLSEREGFGLNLEDLVPAFASEEDEFIHEGIFPSDVFGDIEDSALGGSDDEQDEEIYEGTISRDDALAKYTFKPMQGIEIAQTESMLLQETISRFIVENPEVAVRLIKSWVTDKIGY